MGTNILRAVIDRVEEDKAALEVNGSHEVIFPVDLLPSGAKAGNILDINISLNSAAENEQREKIRKMQEKLKRNQIYYAK